MDKTLTVGQKWLVNELVLSFSALKKSAKAQSNLVILSKVIAVTDDDNDNDNRQTGTVVQTVFFSTRGSQNVEIWWKLSLNFTQI